MCVEASFFEGPLWFVGYVDGGTEKTKVADHTPLRLNGVQSNNKTSRSLFSPFYFALVVTLDDRFR